MFGPNDPDNTDERSATPDFLDAIMDEDGDYEGEADQQTDEEGEGQDGQFATSDGQERSNAEPDQRVPTVQQPSQPTVQTPPADPNNPNGYKRVGTAFADAKGNIVDRAGRILAARGEAARHWYDMAKQVSGIPALTNQVRALQRQAETNKNLITQAQQLAELPRKVGLSREEFNDGIELMSNWKANPVAVAREIVSRTIALGHNVTDILGKTAGDALEMPALRRMVNEITAPIRSQQEQERQRTERAGAAEQQYNAFIARYPDAEVHGEAIANLMENNGLNATEAYHEVRYFAQKHGLDFTQPLGPQIATARAQQQPNGRDQRTTQRAPMSVNGGGSGNRNQQTQEPQMANPDAGWGEILNSVMRESQ